MQLPDGPRTTLLRSLVGQALHHNRAGRRIIAVDGVDGAGKTVFASALGEAFREAGVDTTVASIDGFHRPRAERYRLGRLSPEGFYRDSYDYATFRRVLVDPFRMGGSAGFQLSAFDAASDSVVESRWETAPADAVLVVDGIFLHRPELAGIWNFSVFLDVPWDVAAARVAERDGTDPDPEATSNARYREGQELYLGEVGPRFLADAIVDNRHPDRPRQVFGDFC